MKPMHILMLAGIVLISPAASHAQVAGTTLLGVTVTDYKRATCLQRQQSVGTVDDLIVTPDKAVSYAIVNAGGFLGLAKHYVAIPVSQLKLVDKKLVLPGATKEALKASPEFQYAQ
jgi:PRC-barrel domain